jgi:hypothetical protein
MENNMMSLYDFLGYAAGKELGGLVSKTAVKLKEPIQEREITNTRYKGKVHLYRKEFLEEYFRLKKEADYEPSIGDRQDYQL